MGQTGRTHWVLILISTIVALYAAGAASMLLAEEGASRVASVTIKGNKRIELQAIEGRLTLKANDPYTADALRAQVKILYDTGYFEDVQVETEPGPQGVAIMFVVREKPFITEIVFDGNEELSDDKLKRKSYDQELDVSRSTAGEKKARRSGYLSGRRIFQLPGRAG
ncbi:MAG: POTRA domain-containing protein [Nitrospiraceae bacterium]